MGVQLGMFVGLLGLPDGGLGVIWPSLRHTFHRPVGDLGILVVAGMVPYLGASALSARVVRRTGFGTFTVLIGGIAVLSFLAWATAPVWAVAVAAFAALGWSRGGTDAALNAYASERQGVRRLLLLHAAYGVGATAGPLLVSVVLVLGGGWRMVVVMLAALAGVVTLAAVAARRSWAGPAERAPEAAPGPPDRVPPTVRGKGRHSSGRGGVGAILGAFAVYTAAEAATGAWAFTVLTEGRHLDRGLAGAAVATYWGGLTGSRMLVAAVGHRLARGPVVWGGAALALGGVVLFAAGGRLGGVAGLPLAGLGFGPLFPVMVSVIPDRVEASRAATVIGWAIGVAALGGPAGTAAVGLLAGYAGLPAVGGMLVAFAVTLLVAAVVMFEGVA